MSIKIISIIIAVFIILFCIILLITSRHIILPKELNISKILVPFYKAGLLIAKRLCRNKQNRYYRNFIERNSLLFSPIKAHDITLTFFMEKFAIMVLTLFVGMFFIIIISLKPDTSTSLTANNSLLRENPLGDKYKVSLNATVNNTKYDNILITVNEQKYSEEEFLSSMESFCHKLENDILNENTSLDKVTSDLNLPEYIENYPYHIEWLSDNRHVINNKGVVWPDKNNEDVIQNVNGTIVILSAKITYEDFVYYYEFGINVFPKEKTDEELFLQHLNESIEKNSLDSKESEELLLPDNVDGISISWKEEKTENTIIFIVLILLAATVIFFGKDKDISKKLDERNKQMLDDYPEITSKLTLLISAGMSVRNAWKKTVADYKSHNSDKHYAYEEMILTANEMDSGTEELVAFGHFTSRVKLQKYVKLVSLLEQNVKMGTKSLIEDLQQESKAAFNDKKNAAEKLGEEAGTKLLLPMFMMLLIVMVVIMVPAFCNI